MKILALEFSSPQRSAAVLDSGSAVRTLAEVVETGGPSTKALAMIGEALRQAQLAQEQMECVAVGLGPGSYTGIRAAIAVAQGWELAAGLLRGRSVDFALQPAAVRLLGISSVEAIAAEAHEHGLRGNICVVIDAQRNEFYLADYELDDRRWREIKPLRLAGLAEARALATNALLIGPEVTRWFPRGRVVLPRAATVAKLAESRTDFAPGERLEPIYLRQTQFVKAPPPRRF